MSPHLPYTVEDVVEPVGRRRRGRRRDHPPACPRPEGRPAHGGPGGVPGVPQGRSRTPPTRSSSITSGGGTGMSVEERLRVIYETKPELCTLNLGTFNYGSFPMIPKYAGSWKFDWEEPYLESTRRRAVRQHVRRHRAHAHRRPHADRLAVRVRGLRHRPPLHAGVLPRGRAGRAADLPADDHGRDGRHRRRASSTSRT